MLFSRFFIILAVALLSTKAIARNKGFRIPRNYFEPQALLFSELEQKAQIEKVYKYIKKVTPHRVEALIDSLSLAQEIVHTSSCFQIDPFIFSALIFSESSFNTHAASPTGAVGLTQFTGIGLTEVHDQLGRRGRTGAIEKTIEFWRDIVTGCIDSDWIALWKRTDHLPQEQRKRYQKKILKTDPTLSLTYGALLLKLYWGRVSQLTQDNSEITKYEVYFKALARYNGEPDGRNKLYAEKVLARAQDLFDSN